jgi:hypothetical protein
MSWAGWATCIQHIIEVLELVWKTILDVVQEGLGETH